MTNYKIDANVRGEFVMSEETEKRPVHPSGAGREKLGEAEAAVRFMFEQLAAGSMTPTATYEPVNLQRGLTPKGNQRNPELVVAPPARAIGSSLARNLLAEICDANQLGTQRPAAFLAAISPGRDMLLFMPVVNSANPNAIPVTYDASGFVLNLYEPFRLLGRLLAPGYREIYQWETTAESIQIGDVVGRAFFIRLTGTPNREAIRNLSDAEKEARRNARTSRQDVGQG